MAEPDSSPEDEIRRLETELKRAQREIRQIYRLARTSEEVAAQSKLAMLRGNEKLKSTVEKLEATTEHLRSAKQKAEEANESKSRFLATMSHEIRTPMNGVIGCLDLLMASDLCEDQQQIARVMASSAELLRALINDVLDCAKIEANRVELEKIPFSLMDCLEGVLGQELPAARKKGIDLNLDVRAGVSLYVLGDPTRLRQVLGNLVSNAVKFTEHGGVRLISQPAGGDRIRFQVQDTGIGIPPHVLDCIFDPFTQADTGTTRNYGGTGLGLAICKGLVDLMGGDLSASSTVGGGSCFQFTYELSPAQKPGRSRAAAAQSALAGRHSGRVLLVDDTPTNRLVAGKMLEMLGCQVETASNGHDALDRHLENEYDVIFMDCSMPVMDGYEATRRIRKMDGPKGKVPIIALTAFAMSGDRELCLECGMTDYVSKPVKLDCLDGALSRLSFERRAAS